MKCRRTLKALFFWSRNKIKELNVLKDRLEAEIAELQQLECSGEGISEEQSVMLTHKVHLLNGTLARIMGWWKQRAKVRWIEEGDSNTHLFHSIASARNRMNRILELKLPNGERTQDGMAIMQIIQEFLKQKWQNQAITETGWPSLEAHKEVVEQFAEILDRDVSEEEIGKVVFSLGGNRAPGKDGITASFFKNFWNLVGRQVSDACLDFFYRGSMEEEWKETVVILLPKVKQPDSPSKFRPISLCQTVYKIIAKVLVNRLKGLLPKILAEEQAAFVPGRAISDHCLLAQEMNFGFPRPLKGSLRLRLTWNRPTIR